MTRVAALTLLNFSGTTRARVFRNCFILQLVVAGVSEDALRKKLPQLALGLARQGGPTAAQLARIAMLRLKPSLLVEQLLQPHCLSARNTKVIKAR